MEENQTVRSLVITILLEALLLGFCIGLWFGNQEWAKAAIVPALFSLYGIIVHLYRSPLCEKKK